MGRSGFRISDVISVQKKNPALFKKTLGRIRTLCAVNGIGMTVERNAGCIEILVDGVIYSEGFNKKTFKQTIETLHDVVCEIREMIV